MTKSDFLQLKDLVQKWIDECTARNPVRIEFITGESIQSILNKNNEAAELHGGTLMKADCAKELLELLNRMADENGAGMY